MSHSTKKKAAAFVERLASLRFSSVFNPYAEACEVHDKPNAPSIRRRNLELVLMAALTQKADSMWVARDLGYRGGRRTGLALTDEGHLNCWTEIMGISNLSRATTGAPVIERTATVIWDSLKAIRAPVFLWNVFPLHPHEENEPFTNRSHTKAERLACRPILMELLELLQPRTVVAVGKDAQAALGELGVASTAVRHPSYGGQREFTNGIRDLYGIERAEEPSLFNPASARAPSYAA